MSSPRNPLSLARRWTAGVLLASTLGAGAVGVHLAQDRGTTTASAAGTSGSASASDAGSSSSSSGTSSSTGSTGFSAVPGVSSGTGSAQTSTSGS